MAELNILSNEKIAADIYKLRLKCYEEKPYEAGQFCNIKINNNDGMLLKRPLSVCEYKDNIITLIYEVRGRGTKVLSQINCGRIEVDYFLGNGFMLNEEDKKVMLIGGGIGVAPLYGVIEKYPNKEYCSTLGFKTLDKAFYTEKFNKLCNNIICTDDGSLGERGYVVPYAIDRINSFNPDIILACGPLAMLKALKEVKGKRILVSVEERMGCGIGACLVCAVKTQGGYKRVCKDGPVFNIEELIYE